MQTAVMAAVALRARIGDLDAIESIRVDTTDVGYRFLAKDPAKWRPTTRETADHSLPYTVARALLDGTITRASYDAGDLANPAVLQIIDKISVHEDSVLAAQMPSLANRVTIRDGRAMVEEMGVNTRDRVPVTDAQIEAKFRDFAIGRFDDAQIAEVLDLAWRFDGLPKLDGFMAALAIRGGD